MADADISRPDRVPEDTDLRPHRRRPTEEVGSEGGSPGDVEAGVDRLPGTGSEAGETWRPTRHDLDEQVRDETGIGRRNP